MVLSMKIQMTQSIFKIFLCLYALTFFPGCYWTAPFKALEDIQRQQAERFRQEQERFREAQEQQKRIAEEQQLMMVERRRQLEDERRRHQELDEIFRSLPKEKQAEILLERAKAGRAQNEEDAAKMKLYLEGAKAILR